MQDDDPRELEQAEESLRNLDQKLAGDVGDMVRVLALDVPAHCLRAVRQVFLEHPHADGLDEAAVAALKQDTAHTSQRLGEEVSQQLADTALWRWEAAEPPPESPGDLDAHPHVGPVLGRIGPALEELVVRHGFPADSLGDRAAYRLPTYFVGGQFMKSLVESYWRTLALHHHLERRLQSANQAEARKRRQQRWDSA
jgi:hypothetical protein